MSPHRRQDENRPPRERSKNGRTSVANRDEAVFTSRRQYKSSQPVPEFFTDSLNTSHASHIPSPSPGRPTYGGRNRQARGNNERGLAATYNALGSTGLDSASINSSPTRSSGRRSAQRTRHLASPQRIYTRNTPSPSSSRFRHDLSNGAETPSPTRGRQKDCLVSPASDVSFSSPPVGLADVYQRIQDEETLASQEEDGDDTEGEDWPSEKVLQEVPNNQHRRSWNTSSPGSRREARRLSPRSEIEVACPAPSIGQESLFSELERASRNSSPFEENPDPDPDNDMASQHERDEQRVISVLSHHDKPFRKARRGLSGLTVDNLQRAEGSQSGSNSTGSRSISSRASDLSLNVPKEWGRKGRTNKSWLNRIAEDGSSISKPIEDIPAPPRSESKSESIVDWMENAATVPPQTNNDPLQPSTSSPNLLSLGGRPRLSPHDPRSLPRAHSTTPTNTPPTRTRNAAIDAIRTREIQSLKEQNLTTNRLGELKEKRSLGNVHGHTWSDPKPPNGQHQETQETSTKQSARTPNVDTTEELDLANLGHEKRQQEEDLGKERQRELLPGPKALANSNIAKPSASPFIDNEVHIHAERPWHARGDSMDILRTLSRVESNSPSPQRSARGATPPMEENVVAGQASSGLSSRPESRSQNQELEAQVQEPSDPIPVPELSAPVIRQPDYVSRTPAQRNNIPKAYLKTPLITGGWIETPLPPIRRDTSANLEEHNAKQKALIDAALVGAGADDVAQSSVLIQGGEEIPLRLEDTAPKLPGSALADIVQQAKAKNKGAATGDNDDTLQLDDATIESLEDMVVGSDKEQSSPRPQAALPGFRARPPPQPSVETEEEDASEQVPPRSVAEMFAYQISRLAQMHSNLRDSNKSLSSLQKQVSNSQQRPKHTHTPPTNDQDEDACNEAGEMHDFGPPCERCARDKARSPEGKDQFIEWQTVRIPAPRLWIWQDNGWPRLTKTGSILLLVVGLLTAESIVADRYTPPFYADTMIGYGVDYDMPRPPYILAKLAWRHGLSSILGPVWNFVCILVRFIAAIFGVDAGAFAQDGEDYYKGKWIYREAVWAEPWSGPMGVGGDEYLR